MNEAAQWLKVVSRKPEWQRGAVTPPPLPALPLPNKNVSDLLAECRRRNVRLVVHDGVLSWDKLDPFQPIKLNSNLLLRLEKAYHPIVQALQRKKV